MAVLRRGCLDRPAQTTTDDLFRRGPPWVYPPLGSGTILVATRRSVGARAIEQYERIRTNGLSTTSVVSFHRVRPTQRTTNWRQDPRCRVFAEYTRLESGPAHWTSRCLPNFVVLGTPKSGTTFLFNCLSAGPFDPNLLRGPYHAERWRSGAYMLTTLGPKKEFNFWGGPAWR